MICSNVRVEEDPYDIMVRNAAEIKIHIVPSQGKQYFKPLIVCNSI